MTPKVKATATVADLAAEASGIDWSGLITDRFGAWAAGYFDEGQALWAAPHGRNAYLAWRAVATHDLTPEIAGLAGFATYVSEAPENARDTVARATHRLGLKPEALETYFHRLLMTLGGWAQYARYKLWQADLAGDSDHTLTDFLAIRLLWEEALFERYSDRIGRIPHPQYPNTRLCRVFRTCRFASSFCIRREGIAITGSAQSECHDLFRESG
jgi:uncharacterized protein YbcC (UPF0753/DUF2309 family)